MTKNSIQEILTSKVITVSPEIPISEAVSIMKRKIISCLLVVRDKKPLGIFTERDIVRTINQAANLEKREIKELMSKPVITAQSDINIYKAYNLLAVNRIRHLVIVNSNDELIGVVTLTDILNNLGLEYFVEIKNIAKIMTKIVLTVKKGCLVHKAISTMVDRSISCIIVEENQSPVGVLTERDVTGLLHRGIDTGAIKIEEVMSHPIRTISSDAPVHDAAMIMNKEKIRRLVVVDKEGKIAGLVTQYDIIKGLESAYIGTLKQIIREKEGMLEETLKNLSEKKVYLDNILRSSIDMAIIATDLDFHIRYYNPMAQKIFRHRAEDIIGRTLYDIKIIDPVHFERAIERVRKRNEYKYSFEQKKKQGTRFIESVVSGIWDTEDNLIGFVLMSKDVTEQKHLEQELLKVRKLESIGTLAGGIAHDFNNLLTAIMGNISLAKLVVSPGDEVFKNLTMAAKASLRAKDLTYKLLTFAKGGEPIKKTTYIVELIKNTVNFALSGSNVRCDFFLPDNLWPVEVDEGQISQVIHNIIINAKHAMPEGGNSQVTAKNTIVKKEDNLPLKDGKYVKITIKDQGIGIPENHLAKIFDPYFTTKQKGSGLGLATSYSIIKQHDGYIAVDSEVRKGTIVHIYLPSIRKKALIKNDKKAKPISGQGRVLVMEDEEIVGRVVTDMLKRVGYEATVVRDGNDAIELYKKSKESNNPFDVVILDLTIPGGMGGKETINELLKIDPEIITIVSSGYSNDPIMADYKKYGFKDVITKPYEIEELSKVIHKAINTV